MPDANPAAPDPLVGEQLGSCKISAMLGVGGMAKVYIAKHLLLRKDVAVKVLSPRMSEDPQYVVRFLREAESAKKIQHPNVVRVLEFGQHEAYHYLVMEYLPGDSLSDLIRRSKRLPFDQATALLGEIASGLEAAHGQGVIHRDIKPSNILLARDGTPKIADFGLAREAGAARGITVEGMFMGTPEYVSPEQAEGLLVDYTTDIYSLGVTYYEMLTGRLPFSGQTHVEIAMARLKKPPKPVQEAFPGVDPRAIPIVDKMLKRESTDRYESATELLEVLKPLAKARKKKPAWVEPPPPEAVLPGEVRWKLSGRASLLHVGPGLALLALAGLLAPGAEGWFASIASVAGSQVGLGAAGLGVLGLAWGCFRLRRELKLAKRGTVAMVGFALAGVLAFVGGATLARKDLVAHLLQPVNLLLASIGLVWGAAAASFEQDEDTPPTWIQKGVLLLAAGPWYAASAAGNLLGPLKGIAGSLEALVSFGVPIVFLVPMGILVATARRSTRTQRRLGVFFLALAGLVVLAWGAAGSRGALKSPGEWLPALGAWAGTLPGQVPRSGALAFLAIFVVPVTLRLVVRGLVRHYVEANPKSATLAPKTATVAKA